MGPPVFFVRVANTGVRPCGKYKSVKNKRLDREGGKVIFLIAAGNCGGGPNIKDSSKIMLLSQ
jgi:hypothetical protein